LPKHNTFTEKQIQFLLTWKHLFFKPVKLKRKIWLMPRLPNYTHRESEVYYTKEIDEILILTKKLVA